MAEEKSKTELLREKLMNDPKTIKKLDAEEIKKADEFCEDYKAFLNASPVEREAVRYTAELAQKAGFVEYDPNAEYKAGDRVYLINRGNIRLHIRPELSQQPYPFLSHKCHHN